MAKREKADGLFEDMVKDEPPQAVPPQVERTEDDNELVPITVRLPKWQREALERYLWEQKGAKLAAGVRGIVVEWMQREGIT